MDIETESKDSHRLLGGLGDDMDGSRLQIVWELADIAIRISNHAFSNEPPIAKALCFQWSDGRDIITCYSVAGIWQEQQTGDLE